MNRNLTLTTKITGRNTYFSLISLNINGLNSPIKRHRLTDWLCKQDLTFCCILETYLRNKEPLPQSKRQENNLPSKLSQERSWNSHSNIESKQIST
jgi:exonuclease III